MGNMTEEEEESEKHSLNTVGKQAPPEQAQLHT